MSHGPWEKLLEITAMIERTKITSPPRQRSSRRAQREKELTDSLSDDPDIRYQRILNGELGND
jgi:hypothetical protein